MRPKSLITTVIILGMLFITLGDRVLPKPLSTVSLQARITADHFLMGLFPKKRFRNPNEGTEKAVQKLEQGGTGNQNNP
jgi:hypothetical protein